MNAIHITYQVFRVTTIGIVLIFNVIVPIKSSKLDTAYKSEINLQPTFKNIPRSSFDSNVAENDNLNSYFNSDPSKHSDFSRFKEDIDKQMSGFDFNFDPNSFDQIHLPEKHPTQPKFMLNYEPLRPSNYISSPPTRFKNYPFSTPEHQNDGGDSGGGDDGDGGGNGGGGGDGGDGGNGGGDGGGGGGGSRDGGDRDDEIFESNQSFEHDYDNFEPQNSWNPVDKKYSSNRLDNPYNRKLLPKKVPGYGTNQIPLTFSNYQTPYKQTSAYKLKHPQTYFDDPYSHRLVENRRPLKTNDDDEEDDIKPLKLRGNNRRPTRINEENEKPSYNVHENKSENIQDEDVEEEEEEPSSLQSRRSPTKKRQVCKKRSKSMSPSDIEDHDMIGNKMSCMVCKDLKTGGTFEKCSYKSDPLSEEYSEDPGVESRPKPNKYTTNRFKRRIIDRKEKKPESGEEVEDYEYNNAQESEEDPEYVHTSEAAVDYDNDNPNNFESAENESEEYVVPTLPTKTSTCRKIRKNGNVCNVCKDNMSNRQFEQCEYDEDPQKNAYEYATNKVYGSPRYKRQLDSDQTYDDYFKKLFPDLSSNRKNSISTKFSSKDGDFGFLDNGQIGFKKSKSSLLDDKDLSINFESDEESPVNKMLGEFRNKDRSKCKKSIKNKMTCYKCKDEKGSETEECMYITDSKPKERQQSFHETKTFKTNPEEEKSMTENKSNQNSTQQQTASTSLMHVYAPLFGSSYEPIGQYSHHRPNTNINYRLHNRKPETEEPTESIEEDDPSESQSTEDYEDPNSQQVLRHDMPDVDPFGPEGAYSEETIPMYDQTLKTWLPRYMVVKSSEEAMVDEELGFE